MEAATNDIVPHMKYRLGNAMYAEAVEKRKERFALTDNDGLKRELARRVLAEITQLRPPGRFLKETNRTGKYTVIKDEAELLKIVMNDLTKDNPYFDKKPIVKRKRRVVDRKDTRSYSESNDLSELIMALKMSSKDTEKDPKERVALAAQIELNDPEKLSEERREGLKKNIKGLLE